MLNFTIGSSLLRGSLLAFAMILSVGIVAQRAPTGATAESEDTETAEKLAQLQSLYEVRGPQTPLPLPPSTVRLNVKVSKYLESGPVVDIRQDRLAADRELTPAELEMRLKDFYQQRYQGQLAYLKASPALEIEEIYAYEDLDRYGIWRDGTQINPMTLEDYLEDDLHLLYEPRLLVEGEEDYGKYEYRVELLSGHFYERLIWQLEKALTELAERK
ncbi:hypothetical protein [Lewinella sp. 4G2]|uniref:hypothetical protein n=1 Tax=Lewinella sp. 4G2 TaxID=1803372 RepID=UPI0007B4B65D|nr:hypothetical protein [Lewinella sp. 4G2]OAV44635.1 hypothetical protein A3850_009085 [Lewinella sp. 4G2]